MTSLPIPKTSHRKQQEAPQRDKTTTAYKTIPEDSSSPQKRSDAQIRHPTKRQRRNRKRIDRLAGYWPAVFNREAPKPLKEGIVDDLLQDIATRGLEFGTGALRAAVMSYIQCPRYYVALVAGGLRYDLNGQPCGEVTAEQQESAAERLRKIRSKEK